MLGIDIEKVSRFKTWSKGNYIRIFTDREIEYAEKFNNKLEHYAGFYCVKEALVKALGNKQINFKEIEILHTDSGKPYINKNQYINDLLVGFNATNLEISISHTEDYATAVVILN